MHGKDSPKPKQSLAIFRTLAEPVRIRIFLLLKKVSLTVSELSEILELSQSNTSHHIKALRAVGLLVAEKIGQHTYYAFDTQTLTNAHLQSFLGTLEELGAGITETKNDSVKLKAALAARAQETFSRWRMEQPDLPYSDIFAHISTGKRGKVLDIGCGEGDFFETLSLSFSCVVGVDIHTGHIKKANTRAKKMEKVFALCANAALLPFEAGTFDSIVLRMALSQMEDAVKVLTEAMRVVAVGGYISIIDSDDRKEKNLKESVTNFFGGVPSAKIDYLHTLPRLFLLRAQKIFQ
ncbi:MAG: Ubiquinone/menaquinone biosynthesis C-methyltransferase UbiE [Turneriella sp.]|nr:Ubiquinone/menaquinone biosynthesis C-methyltransferase UbiE [Turneriella sp.]